MTDTTDPMPVEERVARHLAARDWLTGENRWANSTAAFRADYLTAAREVIALVREEPAAVEPPADRAALRDRIAQAIEDAPYQPEDRRSLQLADAVLAVLPEPADQAAEERIEQAEADAEQQARNTLAVANERESYRKAWKDEQQRRVKAEAAVARVRRLHDALDEETALTSPDDEITRGAAARKIAAALDGWTDPAALRRMADETPAAVCGRPASMTAPCSAGDHCCKRPAEEAHVVADGSDDPEHVDDCPGCEAFTLTGHVAASQDGARS